MRTCLPLPLCVALLALSACSADSPLNPSFPLTLDDAKAAIEDMAATPVALQRPVIIVGGHRDPGLATPRVLETIERIGGGDRVITVHFFHFFSFDACRDHLIESIEERFPSSDPEQTVEVDVIAGSMGGIVSRYAARGFATNDPAAPPSEKPRKRLRINRLFTISTPHRGAAMAPLLFIDPLALDMRPGCDFLTALDSHLPDATFELIPYVRLGDMVVGPENAAPQGRTAWWVANQPLQFAHLNCMRDQRILADISRRLRGETPYTKEPAAPLPK